MLYTFLAFLCLGIQLGCSKPWEAERVANNTFWDSIHQLHLNTTVENAETNKIRAIFLGDSITHLWSFDKWGKSTWDKTYVPIGAVNFGISGDKTENVLWRVQNLGLEKLVDPPPKLIVLCIGTNNLGIVNTTDKEIAKGIEEIVINLREMLPQTKILLLGLFPRINIWFGARVANINLQIARLDKETYGRFVNGSIESGYGKMLKYLDMGTHFSLALGEVVPEYFNKDLLHLNADGYQKWAEVMNSTFIDMLQD